MSTDPASALPPEEHTALAREAAYLHQQLLRRVAPAALVENYLRAHAELPELSEAHAAQLRTVRVIVERGLDALGIEPWLRTRRVRHMLTRKLLLLAYLTECDAGQPEFRHRSTGSWLAWPRMGCAVVIAGVSLLRGRMQIGRHGLA